MMQNRGKTNEQWWTKEKKQEKMLKKGEKDNETWWKREEKQGSMMKNRVKTMKNDET